MGGSDILEGTSYYDVCGENLVEKIPREKQRRLQS
jgi:hypothetical protein